jgi:hypothetical protein
MGEYSIHFLYMFPRHTEKYYKKTNGVRYGNGAILYRNLSCPIA